MNTSPWYAIAIRPQSERKAHENLKRAGVWVFYPHIRRKEWRQRGLRRTRIEVERAMFPGYMFVSVRQDRDFSSVNNTDGVLGFVTFGEERFPIPGYVIDAIMAMVDDDGLKLYLDDLPPLIDFRGKVGDRVRMIGEAPFFGLIYLIKSIAPVDKSGNLSIWLESLGNGLRVKADARAVADILSL